MERKIGEIFEFKKDWYQCVESDCCAECSLFTTEYGSGTKSELADEMFGECSKIRRSDNKHIIFKKLEKVGEPYKFQKRTIQTYKIYTEPFISVDMDFIWAYVKGSNTIDIIIKQNKKRYGRKL